MVGSRSSSRVERKTCQTGASRAVDHRSDIYNLGATVFHLLTNRPPFEGRSVAETILQIQSDEPPKPTKYHLSIPPLFEGVVMRMLAKRPQDRYENPTKLVLDLERVARYQGLNQL